MFLLNENDFIIIAIEMINEIREICFKSVKKISFLLRKISMSNITTIICISLIVISGILSWDNIFSLFLILGLVVVNLSLSFTNPQHTRFAVFIKCPLCLTYNIAVGSIGGIIFECASLISAIIGIVKNKKK